MAQADHTREEQRHAGSAELFTRSGEPIKVRPVEPADRALLQEFFRHVSAEDLRFRFLTTLREVGGDRLDAICATDDPDVISFLAFSGDDLVAVATLAGDPQHRRAEVALSTRPEYKSHGISWTLLDHVIRLARAQGYDEIVSIENADNRAAIQLEREMGFSVSLLEDEGGEMIASKPILTD